VKNRKKAERKAEQARNVFLLARALQQSTRTGLKSVSVLKQNGRSSLDEMAPQMTWLGHGLTNDMAP
jgi:hypothetical protein